MVELETVFHGPFGILKAPEWAPKSMAEARRVQEYLKEKYIDGIVPTEAEAWEDLWLQHLATS